MINAIYPFRLFPLCLFLILLTLNAGAQDKTDQTIDSLAKVYLQQANTVGLGIGILKDGRFRTYGYGETAKGNGKVPDANTIFEIGSITKTFNSEILAYYVNQGKISLNDPITQYLPDSVAQNPALQKIKIVNLSNHTSGLARLPDGFWSHVTDTKNPYQHYTRSMLFSSLKNCKLNSEPGEALDYSNQGVGLLGLILEDVSHKKFEQLVKDIITGPLKMRNTVQHLSPQMEARFVKVYDATGKETPAWEFDALAPIGSIRATIGDLLIYAKNNIKTTYPGLEAVFSLSREITFSKDQEIGLGWFIMKGAKNRYYLHDGATAGSSSFLVFNVEKNVAVVLLSNSSVSTTNTAMAIMKRLVSP